jgi:serpin B
MKPQARTTTGAALLAGALIAVAVAGCGGSAGASGDADLVRAAPPAQALSASGAQMQSAALAGDALGLDVYQQLLAEGARNENLAVSPSSLDTALAMLLPGAQGATAAALSRVLGTGGLTPTQYAAALGSLSRQEQSQAKSDKVTLQQADDLWAQRGFAIRSGYLQVLSSAWNTGVHTTDFAADPEGARQAINALVQQETDGEIKNLFPQDGIPASTRMVLTDAVYLHAAWATPFQTNATRTLPFHLIGGGTAEVPTMHSDGSLGYASDTGWQAAELPYQGDHLVMDVLLPNGPAADFAPAAASLTPARLDALLGGLTPQAVDLAMPRFGFDSPETLTPALGALGLTTLFGPAADLSGIPTGTTPLQVNAVVQQTKVDVDEGGTTAAAATGVSVGAAAAQGYARPPIDLDLDHPFLFLIRDRTTGQILFLGQVTQP